MPKIINEYDLLRCPFCGGEPALESWEMSPFEKMNIENIDGRWYAVFCTNCCAEAGGCTSADDAVKAWNMRTED